jgi:hypothetical protein
VFTCKLQSKMVDAYGTTHLRTSRLHLVDLAGEAGRQGRSERGGCEQGVAPLPAVATPSFLFPHVSLCITSPQNLPAPLPPSPTAGSERQKASGAQGERLREATAINKSLSALGNVIMSLVDQQHVSCFCVREGLKLGRLLMCMRGVHLISLQMLIRGERGKGMSAWLQALPA